MTSPVTMEFKFTRRDLIRVRDLVDQHTGIQINESKKDMVYGRLARRLRKMKMTRFSDYIDMLEADDESDEFGEFINAVTTNLTSFFREKHHFEYMKTTLLPELMRRNEVSHRIRIWSAGCSTGEEPYTIAMTVAETMPPGWDVKILATDLDTSVLARAEHGVYDISRIESLNKTTVRRWFNTSKKHPDKVRVERQLQDMISFRQLNLLEKWPMQGPLDIIFCRNVIIYFDMQTKSKLIDRYANLLPLGGSLILGHSEAMNHMSERFASCGKSVYSKSY